MALVKTALASVGQGGGNQLFLYRTPDLAATVAGANYFDAVANILNVGDVIFATTGIGGTVLGKIYVVTANTGSAVTVLSPAGLT